MLVPLSRLSFLSFVISALNTAPRAWLFRNMKVRETALLTILALIVSGITGVVLAWNGFAYWGIAVQNLMFCLMLTVGSWWFSEWHPTFHINLRPLRGMIGFSSRLLATNIQANKWTGMGYTMLTGMVWSVTQPLFARLSYNEPERMQQVFRKMLRLTAFLSCPALFGLALVAPEFIEIAITAKWLPSAYLMQILCIGGAFVPISSFYSNFVVSQGKSQLFMWNTMALCVAQLLLLIGMYRFGVQAMVIAYVVLNTLWLFVWHHFVQRLIGLKLRLALRDVLPFCAIAALSMALAWFAARGVTNIYASLVIKVVVAAASYVLMLRLLGAQIMNECREFLLQKMGRRK